MPFKKSLLNQAIILATIASITPSAKAMKISDLVRRGYPTLNPMASESVDGFGVNNELFLLTKRQENALKDGVFYVNGRLNASVDYVNHSGDYNLLHEGTSQVLPTEIKLDITASKGPFTGFIELSNYRKSFGSTYSVITFLPKTNIISSLTNAFNGLFNQPYNLNFNQVNVNQAYLMLGDLNKYPVYFLAGRKTVDYGMFDELDWFWKPVTNFWSPGTEDQVAVGYYNNGLHAAWSVFNGKTMAESNTGSFNNIANWAATLSYETPIQEIQSKFGISYLNGIVGDLYGNTSQKGATYHKGLYRNPAGIIFGKIKYKALTLSGLYQQAFKENNWFYKPRSWGATAKVDFNMMNRENWVALNYSWQRITKKVFKNKTEEDQILVGWNIALTKSISVSLQYGRLKDKYKYFQNAINTYNVVNLGLYAYF